MDLTGIICALAGLAPQFSTIYFRLSCTLSLHFLLQGWMSQPDFRLSENQINVEPAGGCNYKLFAMTSNIWEFDAVDVVFELSSMAAMSCRKISQLPMS